MIKEYEVTFSADDVRTYDDVNELKSDVFNRDLYAERNNDSLCEMINENNHGFEYGAWEWSATEVLENMGVLDDVLNEEADYYCDELRNDYEDPIDELAEGDSVEIYDLGITVELKSVRPENEEEAEELGVDLQSLSIELDDLLTEGSAV